MYSGSERKGKKNRAESKKRMILKSSVEQTPVQLGLKILRQTVNFARQIAQSTSSTWGAHTKLTSFIRKRETRAKTCCRWSRTPRVVNAHSFSYIVVECREMEVYTVTSRGYQSTYKMHVIFDRTVKYCDTCPRDCDILCSNVIA